MTIAKAIINILPLISHVTKIYFTIQLNDNTFNEATIIQTEVMHGNINLTSTNLFIPYDTSPIAIKVTAIFNTIEYVSILYTKAVYSNELPNNFTRIIQKIPYGVFLAGTNSNKLINRTPYFTNGELVEANDNTIIGNDMMARSMMIDDYYSAYFNVVNQVYSTVYSTDLEQEYNGTIGLLSNSVYSNELFHLLASMPTYLLNSFDLELFLSQYIYYRLGAVSAVYVNDHIVVPGTFWQLGISGYTELGTTTILASGEISSITNLDWIIFNASSFTDEFKQEITSLIIRISRADLGNSVVFNNFVNPTLGGFTLVGPTYKNDPRMLYGKCIEYLGTQEYPLNIIGYLPTA